VVVNSWMPSGLNLTPEIRDINAKVIIYIAEREATGVTNYDYSKWMYPEGIEEEDRDAEKLKIPNPILPENGISYHLGKNYRDVFRWYGPAHNEVSNMGRYENSLGDRDCNHIIIQIKKGIPTPNLSMIKVQERDKYLWEKALEKVKGPVEKMSILDKAD